MPRLEFNREYVARTDSYREQPPNWYRERLVVFLADPVDGNNEQVSDGLRRFLNSVADVIEAPFVESDARIFAPMTNFIIRRQAAGGEASADLRIRKHIDKISKDLGLGFVPRITITQAGNNLVGGVFSGSALFSPERRDDQIGRVEVLIDHSIGAETYRTEYDVVLSGVDHPIPAGVYRDQDRLAFGVIDRLPASLDVRERLRWSVEAQDWEKVEISSYSEFDSNALCLILPSTFGNANSAFEMVFLPVCPKARELLSAQGRGTESQPDPISLVSKESGARVLARSFAFGAATGMAEVDVSDGLLSGRALRDGHKATLRLLPNEAASRLREVPNELQNGYCEVRGLLLPSPSAMSKLRELVVNFTPEMRLLPHAFEAHAQSIVVQSSGFFGRTRDLVSVATSQLGVITERHPLHLRGENPVGPMHRLEYLHFLESFSASKDQNERGAVQDKARALPEDRFLLLRPRDEGGKPLGYFGVPMRDVYEDPTSHAEAEVTYFRSNRDAARFSEVCLDWLDSAAKVVVEDQTRINPLLGYGRFWVDYVQKNYAAHLPARQKFRLVPDGASGTAPRSRLAFHVDQGETLTLRRGLTFWIGPLLVRWTPSAGSS